MSMADATQARLGHAQSRALLVAVVGLAACAGAGLAWPGALFPAYLAAYLFWTGIALGCSSLLMLHNLTGGVWGLLIRRPLEAGALTIVPMAVLFVPIALRLQVLYPWARPEVIAEHPAVQKSGYLTPNAFLIRAGVSFAIWIALASLLHRGAIRRDDGGRGGLDEPRGAKGDSTRSPWLARISGPGLGVLFLTGSFAAIDWAMSLEPEWYSTIYGAMMIVGWGLLTFATMTLITAMLAQADGSVAEVATPSRFQDLGNLMLAFVMLWAYLSFSQFLIIWSGNLVEEIPWYLRRLRGGWQYVALALIAFHFFAPFFALLFRDTKRKMGLLMVVAAAIIVMHLVDLSWMVLPASAEPLGSGSQIRWGQVLLVPVAAAGLGGAWAWAFLWNLRRRPLVPDELAAMPTDPHASHGDHHG